MRNLFVLIHLYMWRDRWLTEEAARYKKTAAICAIRAIVGPNGPTNDADSVEVATVHA